MGGRRLISLIFNFLNFLSLYWLIAFDISLDKHRRRTVKACKMAGLVRIQRSVFAGKAIGLLIQQLRDKVTPWLDAKTDSFVIVPLDRTAWARFLSLGKPLSKTTVSREQKQAFF
jgi:CRISPR-associated endonuclease Cas2